MSDRTKAIIWYAAMLVVIAVAALLVVTSVHAEYHGYGDGKIARIYCVIPLPPGS